MRRRISIRGLVRPSVRRSVRRSVRPVLFFQVKSTHARRILCRVSGLAFYLTGVVIVVVLFMSFCVVLDLLLVIVLFRGHRIQEMTFSVFQK